MRSSFLALGLIGTAFALPRPQDIDLDGVAAAEPPVIVTPPYDVAVNTPAVLTTTSAAPIPTDDLDSRKRRDIAVEKRDGTCAAQPAGSGPVPSPDTVAAFQTDPDLQVCVHMVLARTVLTNILSDTGHKRPHSIRLCVGLHESRGLGECTELHGFTHPDQLRFSWLCQLVRPRVWLLGVQCLH